MFAAHPVPQLELAGVLMLAGAVGALAVLFGHFYVASSATAPRHRRAADPASWRRSLGGAIFGGLLGKLIADALVKTGVLNNFPIARSRVREI